MLTLFTHSAASIAYAAFGCLVVVRTAGSRGTACLVLAAFATAAWAASAPLIQLAGAPAWLGGATQTIRDAGWFSLLLVLMLPNAGVSRPWLILATATSVVLLADGAYETGLAPAVRIAGLTIEPALTRIATAVIGLVLIENLLRNATNDRLWSVKFLGIALISIQTFELLARIPEFLTHQPLRDLIVVRPLVYLVVLPLFVVTAVRSPSLRLDVHTSRRLAFHSATLIGVGIVLQGAALAAFYVRAFGGADGTILAVMIAFGTVVAVATGLASASARSRLRLFINENFFSYKYDYRVEWERFIRCLANWQDGPIPGRALRTLTELLDSPGGVVWLSDEPGEAFRPLAKWSFAGDIRTLPADDRAVTCLQPEESYVELAAATPDSAAGIWHERYPDAWLVVPLPYRGTIAGIALLQPPRAPRRLDWEDRRLIGLVGMELGALLAQDQTARALADARELEDFNKRTAFIVHDLKNTAGQLSLIVQNAERFGDNADFRRDMVLTVAEAATRLQDLLGRLKSDREPASQPAGGSRQVDLLSFLREFVRGRRERGILIELETPLSAIVAIVDERAFRSVLEHVVANAVEANAPGAPVHISAQADDDGSEIIITDHGPGMTKEFIATELFRPFKTSKARGFGIGAYQVKQIMRDLGGEILVESEPGAGTRVSLRLPPTRSTAEAINA